MRLHVLLAAALAVSGACASSSATAGASTSPQAAPRVSRNVITEADLAGSTDQSVYDWIARVRPTFLRSRNPGTPVPVYHSNGLRVSESVEGLRTMGPGAVREVRFLEPQDAHLRFGPGHSGGAIVVTLK